MQDLRKEIINMKKLEEMSNEELIIIKYILLIISIIGLIIDAGIIIINIVQYDSYSPAMIIFASIAIVAFIINIIGSIKIRKGLKKKE